MDLQKSESPSRRSESAELQLRAHGIQPDAHAHLDGWIEGGFLNTILFYILNKFDVSLYFLR